MVWYRKSQPVICWHWTVTNIYNVLFMKWAKRGEIIQTFWLRDVKRRYKWQKECTRPNLISKNSAIAFVSSATSRMRDNGIRSCSVCGVNFVLRVLVWFCFAAGDILPSTDCNISFNISPFYYTQSHEKFTDVTDWVQSRQNIGFMISWWLCHFLPSHEIGGRATHERNELLSKMLTERS